MNLAIVVGLEILFLEKVESAQKLYSNSTRKKDPSTALGSTSISILRHLLT